MSVPFRISAPRAGALLLAALSLSASAAAPQVRTQPGYYRLALGSFEVTALSDGVLRIEPTKLLQGRSSAEIVADLTKAHLKEPVDTSMNAFLVNTGTKLVLIDTGGGGGMADGGKLLQSLANAGYAPAQVDEIYITHMHGDHLGNLAKDGTPMFPNAIVRADKADAAFWLDEATADAAPEDRRGSFKVARDAFAPYVKTGRFKPFDGATELVPGIRSVARHGHTPGHSSYVVESGGQKLEVIGDMIHVGAVQFAHPEVVIGFDRDSKQAAADRREAFDAAAKDGRLVAAAHLSFPGIGYIDADGSGYRWVPVNYAPVR
ncbi:MAG TPA: MBL fold metallo-hydrolase [Tahibacter sp.]|uniref:MBL fold metallo-hydrolase n=1 Tax=Tahibacter sp. TaxID=2056211 RepID=UPI002C5ED612|nr:MBL fold metallo-hydrolase [Tahibacter sp.]HSX59004.1 MBL fold metallo-hydrolase [Tahibacter sp.]